MRAGSHSELTHTRPSAAETGYREEEEETAVLLKGHPAPVCGHSDVSGAVSPHVNSHLLYHSKFLPFSCLLLEDEAAGRCCRKWFPSHPPPIAPTPHSPLSLFIFREAGISQDKETAAVLGKRNQSRLSNLWTISH